MWQTAVHLAVLSVTIVWWQGPEMPLLTNGWGSHQYHERWYNVSNRERGNTDDEIAYDEKVDEKNTDDTTDRL